MTVVPQRLEMIAVPVETTQVYACVLYILQLEPKGIPVSFRSLCFTLSVLYALYFLVPTSIITKWQEHFSPAFSIAQFPCVCH